VPVATSDLARQARDQARQILSNPPFSSSQNRSPLTRLFHDLGQWLYDVVGPVWRFLMRHLFHPVHVGLSVAFGRWWPVALGAIILVVAGAVGIALGRRRARVGTGGARRIAAGRGEDPDELDDGAAAAERAGDFALAVRLRFRAGLLRLEDGGLISGGRTHTSSQLAGVLHSPTFDSLARQLDAIVYAGVPAAAEDAGTARQGWPRVPAEARRALPAGAGAGASRSVPASVGGGPGPGAGAGAGAATHPGGDAWPGRP